MGWFFTQLDRPVHLTFAMFPISGVSGLTDALVGFGGVLAEGVNVAVVGPLNAFVDICGRRKRHHKSLHCLETH